MSVLCLVLFFSEHQNLDDYSKGMLCEEDKKIC